MTNMIRDFRSAGAGMTGFSPFRFLSRVVVLVFALIQLVLVARILLDLGVIPPEGAWSERIISWSDTLAAPVEGVGSGIGGIFGGGELGMMPGTGFNPVMVAALAGWSVVEWLVMRVVRKLASV
jgi:hypothetical protein